MDKTMLKRNADQNPFTLKPSISLSVNKIMNVLMTTRNKPNVKITAGKEKKINKGFTNAFKQPRTSATITAVRKLSTYTPGNK